MNIKTPRNQKFLEFNFQQKTLYVVKDHATALITWKKAYDERLIDKNATLFHIDRHTDFCFGKKNQEKSEMILEMENEDFIDFFLNDLHPFNDEFIVNAMFSGLIKDGISISIDDGSDFGEFIDKNHSTTKKNTFTHNGIEHNNYLYQTEDISNLIGFQRLIGDTCIHQDVNELFKINNDLILDIDLDFFTYINNCTYSKHPEDIKKQITSDSFKQIFDKCKIISIALEPESCGGYLHCLDILFVLNQHWLIPNNLDLFEETKVFLHNLE